MQWLIDNENSIPSVDENKFKSDRPDDPVPIFPWTRNKKINSRKKTKEPTEDSDDDSELDSDSKPDIDAELDRQSSRLADE